MNHFWNLIDEWISLISDDGKVRVLCERTDLRPAWDTFLRLSRRSATACWSCSWATSETGSTVLASSESVGCWWPSVPRCWPCLTSCRSPTNTTLFYKVRRNASWHRFYESLLNCSTGTLWHLLSVVPLQLYWKCLLFGSVHSAANGLCWELRRSTPAELLNKWERNSSPFTHESKRD